MPSKTKIINRVHNDKTPLLQKYDIDTKLEQMHSPIATAKKWRIYCNKPNRSFGSR